MKTRESFVANSSSTSFVMAYNPTDKLNDGLDCYALVKLHLSNNVNKEITTKRELDKYIYEEGCEEIYREAIKTIEIYKEAIKTIENGGKILIMLFDTDSYESLTDTIFTNGMVDAKVDIKLPPYLKILKGECGY